MKVLQIPYSFQWGIWPFNAGIVLLFSLKWWFALFINIKYQMLNISYYIQSIRFRYYIWWTRFALDDEVLNFCNTCIINIY